MNGSSIIITGGGSGIGAATASVLAREGARLCIADINLEAAQQTVSRIEQSGGTAFACAVDIAKEADNARMVRETVERFGSLNGVFLNAGIPGELSLIRDFDLSAWQKMLDVNLTGTALGLAAAVPHLKAGGSVVITSSFAGLHGSTGGLAYTAAKHGVVGLAKAAAAELAKDGIRVNSVCPGFIQTPMQGDMPAEVRRLFANMAPLQRIAEPEEVGELVAFLLSDKSRFITAQTHAIDGGLCEVLPEGEAFPSDGKSVAEFILGEDD